MAAYTNGKANMDAKDGRRMADEIIPLEDIRLGLRSVRAVPDDRRGLYVAKEKQELAKRLKKGAIQRFQKLKRSILGKMTPM